MSTAYSKTTKKKLTIGIALIIFLATFVWFGFKIQWSLGCLAYYEQCTANRVTGITERECHQRADMVAYLLETKVCLVKPSSH